MSYPHTYLFHGEHKTIVISGPHIQVLDSNSGVLLRSTVSLDGIRQGGPVRCAAVDHEYIHLATVGDDKQLKVWAIDSLDLLNERELPKRPTQISFMRSGQTIVVADKFGDVFRFVSAIHIPSDPTAHHVLVSGGGDSVLKVWEWRAGRRLYDIAIEETVRPFIVVRRARRKRGYDSDGERKPPTRRWLARERRRQAKAATPSKEEAEATPTSDVEELGEDEEEEEEAEIAVESGDEVDDDVVKDATLATPSREPEPEEPPAPVLVVQKIETLDIGGRLVLAFSAVGATALFWFAVPADVPEGLPIVHAHDFGGPIVTFSPVSGSKDCVWVSLDANWTGEGQSSDVTSHVRLLRLTLDSANEISILPPLLSTLNGASVIPANESEIFALQLYEALTSLPKNIDATHNPMIRDPPPDFEVAKAKGNRNAKAVGKMRTRIALLERSVRDEPPAKKVKEGGTEEIGDVMDES
ncbi:hypothetical protein BGW80DRAFT_1565909 [Lactifluus volemus]|nr:hypothetical protein BGW80DRAFT_1565909 [Lactifluus volemus]